jgi:hypothetical protein
MAVTVNFNFPREFPFRPTKAAGQALGRGHDRQTRFRTRYPYCNSFSLAYSSVSGLLLRGRRLVTLVR